MSRKPLRAGIEWKFQSDTANNNVLQVYHPGMVADAFVQAKPLDLASYGNALFVQPLGEKYSSEQIAEETATYIQDLQTRKNLGHRAVVLIGVSMGGQVVHKVSQLLQPEADAREVHFGATMIDAPTTRYDLLGKERFGAPIIGRLPFGPTANRVLPRIPMAVPSAELTHIPVTMWRDQIASFTGDVQPALGSLKVGSLATWASQLDTVVDGEQAAATWRRAFGYGSQHRHLEPRMEHAGFDNNPTLSRDTYEKTLAHHYRAALTHR